MGDLFMLSGSQLCNTLNWDSFNRFFPYLHEWFLCNNNTSYKSKKKISFSVVLATCQVLDSYM